MSSARKMMGFESPSDQKVTVRVGDWDAVKLAIWRSRTGWDIAARAAAEILAGCEHTDGCFGKKIETEPCLPGCKDREARMSALVILNAARMHAPTNARRPADGPYFAPSREYFSEVLAELAAVQVELEAYRLAFGSLPTESPAALEEKTT